MRNILLLCRLFFRCFHLHIFLSFSHTFKVALKHIHILSSSFFFVEMRISRLMFIGLPLGTALSLMGTATKNTAWLWPIRIELNTIKKIRRQQQQHAVRFQWTEAKLTIGETKTARNQSTGKSIHTLHLSFGAIGNKNGVSYAERIAFIIRSCWLYTLYVCRFKWEQTNKMKNVRRAKINK